MELLTSVLCLGFIYYLGGAPGCGELPKRWSALIGWLPGRNVPSDRPSIPRERGVAHARKAAGLATVICLAGMNTSVGAATSYSFSVPYAWWSFPSTHAVLETDIQIMTDPGTIAPYFLSQQFGIVDWNGELLSGGYVGLQTQVTETGGKGILFSVFDDSAVPKRFETAGGFPTFDPSLPNSGGCRAFGGEGTGIQCFMAYSWQAGRRYKLRVEATGTTAYTASVIDASAVAPVEPVVLGTIYTLQQTYLGNYTVQWLEYYGGLPASCADYPYIKALWYRPVDIGASPVVAGIDAGTVIGGGYCKNSNVWDSGVNHYQEVGTPGGSATWSIQDSSGYYVRATWTSADGCGGSDLTASSTAPDECARFTRIPLTNGKVAWQTDDGYRLTCAGRSGSVVRATARTISSNESFTEKRVLAGGADAYSYRSLSGYYLTVTKTGGGGRRLTCNANSGANQLFFLGSAP